MKSELLYDIEDFCKFAGMHFNVDNCPMEYPCIALQFEDLSVGYEFVYLSDFEPVLFQLGK